MANRRKPNRPKQGNAGSAGAAAADGRPARARKRGPADRKPAKPAKAAKRTRPADPVRAKKDEAERPTARTDAGPETSRDAGPDSGGGPRLDLAPPVGPRPPETGPAILTVDPGADYALLDSGDGEKIERYGDLTVRRPENQALWPRRSAARDWDGADAVFTGDIEEEGAGRWRFSAGERAETWPLSHDGMAYLGRFTAFRHVGVFPEQAAHWRGMERAIRAADRPVRVLNLFGYTGIASLVAARAGADVTHVDASKKAIGWARENQAVAGLEERPIRWICEDAVRYAEREVRRGKTYHIVLLDPPKYGRGPKGETWHLFSDLPYLARLARALAAPDALSVVLTAYSIRASFYALSGVMGEAFRGAGGTLTSGELVIREAGADARLLSTSLYSRWDHDG